MKQWLNNSTVIILLRKLRCISVAKLHLKKIGASQVVLVVEDPPLPPTLET